MEDFVTIATYLSLAEAEPPRLALEEAGIHALATDENMGSLLGTNMVFGIKLQVAAADAQRAREVLAELESQSGAQGGDADDAEDSDDGVTMKCPQCGADLWFPSDRRGEVEVCPECEANVTVPE